MQDFQSVFEILPPWLRQLVEQCALNEVEDIRFRCERPPSVCIGEVERELSQKTVSQREIENILLAAADHSSYAVQDRLSEGFLTIPGGHRIGVCGSVVQKGSERITVKQISSLCIRLARRIPMQTLPKLTQSTLLIGIPGSGKTTLLRECIRSLSDAGRHIGLSDERGEIAACIGGVAQFDVGRCTDVMTGGKKADNLLSMLRSMRPHWLAADEITAPEDLQAIALCADCGVHLIATAHASSEADLFTRPLYQSLMELQVFKQLVILNSDRTWTQKEVD